MDDRLAVLVYHIRDTAAEIAGFVRASGPAELQSNLMLQRALVMSLMIIGELVSRIHDRHQEFVAGLPDVPWDQIRGRRNRIAHGYFELDLDVIWTAATVDIPMLAAQIVTQLDGSNRRS